jgi:dihydrofolate synthase/folylpolyglutamate synthase
MLDRLGRPQEVVPVVHVAGTRGKGSTCALLSAALHASGVRVGLNTSPHLLAPTERIRIAERDVSEELLLALAGRVGGVSEDLAPSYFEVMTAAAFLAFAEADVELAVVEVGLGGRLDATNVCRPLVTAITRLGLEHQDRLGTTLPAIAREKAGILKPGVPAVLAPNAPEAVAAVAARAAEVGAPLTCLGPEDVAAAPAVPLPGAHQRENAAVAATTLARLAEVTGGRFAVPSAAAASGFAGVRWRARAEVVPAGQVDVLVDVAHDGESVAALMRHLELLGRRPAALVFSCLADKDLGRLASLAATSPACREALVLVPVLRGPRARPAAEVVAAARALGLTAGERSDVATAVADACAVAAGHPDRLVVVFGSFLVAGDALRALGA